jgi:Domain of unknown function (DUF6265)
MASLFALIPLAPAPREPQQTPPRVTIREVAWLEGTWVSTAGPRTVEERWTPPGGGAMLAVSRTLNGERLVEFEYLRIIERDGTLVYVAQPGGRPPTDFQLTHLEGKSATFENPSHDFPKIVTYKARPDGSLEASISGEQGQRRMSWVFERK